MHKERHEVNGMVRVKMETLWDRTQVNKELQLQLLQ
jgi:hypothetical protein